MPEFDSTIQYRDVVGFPGYKVGSDGSVWSCWHKAGKGWRYGFSTVQGEWHELRQSKAKGRPIVCIFPGPKWVQVCRLVLAVFVGPCPPGMECCHDPDPDPTNNRLSNLRWGTRASNMADRDRHGNTVRGVHSGMAKLDEAQVVAIRTEYAAKRGRDGKIPNGLMAEMVERYNVHPATINRVVLRRSWKHL